MQWGARLPGTNGSNRPALRWDSCTKFIGELQPGLAGVATSLPFSVEEPDTASEGDRPTVHFCGQRVTAGMLLVDGELVQVPLKQMDVRVNVVGATAEVYLTQIFVNTHDRAIEATYVFPLPDDAAVHRMRMIVDDRIIESEVREKEEAREVYTEAKKAGHGAALVEQTTPNIFTSSVANILPGLHGANEAKQSEIFKKIYTSEFITRGGTPYGAMIGDYEFTNYPDDIELLTKISRVFAEAFCPFISAASSKLFGLDNWTDLSKQLDLKKIFDTVEHAQWKRFRDNDDSRFVLISTRL